MAADGGGPRAAEGAERFPCPKCGAGLLYDPGSRGLRCPFCGEARSIDGGGPVVERDLAAALREAERVHGERREAAAERRCRCDACAAEVAVPATEKAGRCAWCGSTKILGDAPDPGRIPPEAVLPFALDRVKAEERFRAWIRSLWFRPTALRRAHAAGTMTGLMVPYWTFDAAASSRWTAMAGYHYYVTTGSGKNARRVRHTRWVPAAGSRRDRYDDLLVCASRGLHPGLAAKIEPFPLEGLRPYRDDYLAGLAAESYAVDVKAAWTDADRRIRAEQESRCAGDVPGDTHTALSVSTDLSDLRYRHVLLPVWVAAYSFRGKVYRYLVNGCTGEVQGEAPWSWVKITLAVLAVLAAAGLAVLLANG